MNAYLENRATAQLKSKLDKNNYRESELISVKVPVSHLSYFNCSNQFVRVDGQIEIRGLQYNYVKRRLFNDSIEMLCIPNQVAIHLNNAKNDFFKLVNDLQHPDQGKRPESHFSKTFTGDYWTVNDIVSLKNLFYIIQVKYSHYTAEPCCNSVSTEEHPPQKIA